MKYQFCIRFDKVDVNSSATKAVVDCNVIFSKHGYQDYTFVVDNNSNKKTYYYKLIKEVLSFFLEIKRNSLVGIQYPLLSVNKVFKYFIKIARLKKVKFFCIVHDLESLRTGGKDKALIKAEIDNLNRYDLLIVHNQRMMDWLKAEGVVKPMIDLLLFDYLADESILDADAHNQNDIVYAGNLVKSAFIYKIPEAIRLKVYGPGFASDRISSQSSVNWAGVFSPSEIVEKLSGTYGLIWDGTEVEAIDDVLGNYLRYNNPHKVSLYLAAGLPVIAPRQSAVAELISEYNIGILIDSLYDLQNIDFRDESAYSVLKNNVAKVQKKVIEGGFFSDALSLAEEVLDFKTNP